LNPVEKEVILTGLRLYHAYFFAVGTEAVVRSPSGFLLSVGTEAENPHSKMYLSLRASC